jgi:catechol 2,3-dioxygenase-like lactoylglutathione lyase family enzyme
MTGGLRLARFALNCPSPARTADFFVAALGFSRADYPPGLAGGAITLRLGPSRLDLTLAGPHARPYPKALPPWSARFQHLAIVTPDMASAMQRLRQTPGWTAISRGGPQRLPASSGGVTAFKFRDPDGHPLELISFPGGDNAPRIDHSAISVADTARSVAFYRSLGAKLGARSINRGPEQDRLDGRRGVDVAVTALIPPAAPAPHIELLCYRGDYARGPVAGLGDVAATRLILTTSSVQNVEELRGGLPVLRAEPLSWPPQTLMLRDPDGHLLGIELSAALASE